ncbi:MAG TPA: dipeptidase PepE [Chitinophagaceae bacterium]|nr:dipeptidase PepE [Chitinophagaceae bacterium]
MKIVHPKAKMLILSTSTIHGSGYLEYVLDTIKDFLKGKKVLFVPYARPSGISHEEYTQTVKNAMQKIDIEVEGLHNFENPKEAIRNAEAIFIGGGNTFLLLKTLYELDLIEDLRDAIHNQTPYIGSSAGSNITGQSIGTTNDMPIVYPPSFKALGILPFNINPHYLDPDPNSTHKGETRETRIFEFHKFNSLDVIGLREGSWLEVENGNIFLRGKLQARIFQANQDPKEIDTDSQL